jgi:hypothetical protein
MRPSFQAHFDHGGVRAIADVDDQFQPCLVVCFSNATIRYWVIRLVT